MTKYNIKTIKLVPLQEEAKHWSATVSGLADILQIDDIPTLHLPKIGINQQLIQPSLAVPKSEKSSSHALISVTQTASNESYLEVIRNLVKNSGIYAISSLASPLITLLLSPFLAHILSRTDYGALSILNTVVSLATGILELGLGSAFTRMYTYDCKTRREQLDALSTLVLFLLLTLMPITAIGVIAAPWLSALILGSSSYSGAVQVGAVLVLSQNLTVPGLVWLRAESRAAFFSIISIANLLVTAGTTIVLVGTLHMGVAGSLVANGLGDVIIIACTLPIIFWHAGFRLRFAMAGSMLSFGVPNVMNLISNWVLQLSDRYLLGHFTSLSLAAGYAVAYSLSGVLSSAIISPFSLAWWVLMFSIAKRKDAQYVFKLIFRWFSIVMLFATLGLSLFGTNLLDSLFPASYHSQSSIIPVIALSTMFNGIFVVVSLATSLKRKTWLASLYFIISALVNVGFNILLIPIYSTMGAALATLIAYFVLASIAYLFNQRIYPVPFEVGLFFVALGIGVTLYLVDNELVQQQSFVMTSIIHISSLLLYGLCLLFLGCPLCITRIAHGSIIDRKSST